MILWQSPKKRSVKRSVKSKANHGVLPVPAKKFFAFLLRQKKLI